MNKQNLTPEEAWQDFYTWVKQQPTWQTLSRAQKQYLDKTNRAVRDGTAGATRMIAAFEKYAPGRYVWRVVFDVVT